MLFFTLRDWVLKNGTMQSRQGSFQSDSFRQKSNESYYYDEPLWYCYSHKSYYEALEEMGNFSGNNNDELLLPLWDEEYYSSQQVERIWMMVLYTIHSHALRIHKESLIVQDCNNFWSLNCKYIIITVRYNACICAIMFRFNITCY